MSLRSSNRGQRPGRWGAQHDPEGEPRGPDSLVLSRLPPLSPRRSSRQLSLPPVVFFPRSHYLEIPFPFLLVTHRVFSGNSPPDVYCTI